MSTLYIITGPAGVGKSTISKKIAESLSKSVLIEGDDIYSQVVGGYVSPWKEGNHLEIFWQVSMDIIKDYLEAGYDVVFNYIINPAKLSILNQTFKNYDKRFVVLLVDEETLLKRDALRPEDCQMKDRCVVLLNNFKKHNYDEKFIIDTSKTSIEESASIAINDERFVL
jgi:shikimate kinase